MPGHIFSAKCECGYKRSLYPGFNPRTGALSCIAYNKEQTELATVEQDKAEAEGLTLVPSPVLEEKEPISGKNGIETTYGHFLCPSCKDSRLVLVQWGNWD